MSSSNGLPASPAERLFVRFTGLERAHGSSRITGAMSSVGKVETTNETIYAGASVELWQAHIDGHYGIGIVPIRDDATVRWGAIDIDGYPNTPDLPQIAKDVLRMELPLIVCRTKSGGAHLYLFTSEPIAAGKVREKLMNWAVALGHSGVEVFPKQVRLAGPRDHGNWINMPYFNAGNTERYALNADGIPLTLTDFLDLADTLAVSASELEDLGMPSDMTFNGRLTDAPPCLQCIAGRGGAGEGQRNKMMFNVGVMLTKMYGDQWEGHFDSYNQPPFVETSLPSKEMQTLVKSINRKKYEYTCNESPLAPVCSRQICLTRKFGIGTGDSDPGVVFGGLLKVNTQPPIWIWDVDGARIELTTEQLKDQGRFHTAAMEVLNKWPRALKPQEWATLIRNKLETCEVVDVPPDARPDGQMWSLLQEYCTGRAKAKTRDELLHDKPWTPTEGDIERYGAEVKFGRTYFRSKHFMTFLIQQRMPDVSERRLWGWLRKSGAEHHAFTINGKHLNVWSIPAFLEQTEPNFVPRLQPEEM